MQSTKNETNIQKQIQNSDIYTWCDWVCQVQARCCVIAHRSRSEACPRRPPRSWCGVHAARCEPASFDAAPSKVSISWQTRLRIQSRQNWSLASQRICHLCAATYLLRSRHVRPSVVRLGLPSSSPLLCDRSSVEVGGVPAPTPPDRGAAIMPAV